MPDTVFFAASAAKAATVVHVHVLAERVALDYDTGIAELWPEFAAHGKDRATVRHALTHSAGVPVLPKDLPTETFTDWDAMCAAIAGLEPQWAPGEATTAIFASFAADMPLFNSRPTSPRRRTSPRTPRCCPRMPRRGACCPRGRWRACTRRCSTRSTASG
jgi:hypothetical protein